jgi:hypothetical protein
MRTDILSSEPDCLPEGSAGVRKSCRSNERAAEGQRAEKAAAELFNARAAGPWCPVTKLRK